MASLYEILAIIDPDENDDGVDAIIGGFRQVLTQAGGEIAAVDKWGRRKLAYPIKKKEEGFYVLIHVEGPAEVPGAFRAHTKIRESVFREMVLRLEGAHLESVLEKLEGVGPEDAALAAEQIAAAEQRAAEKRAAAAMTGAEAVVSTEPAGTVTVTTAGEVADEGGADEAVAEVAADVSVAEVAADEVVAEGAADEPAEATPAAAEAAPAEGTADQAVAEATPAAAEEAPAATEEAPAGDTGDDDAEETKED